MGIYTLTEEQKAIINHPLQHHAKILAVAGSGKTSTLVHRIKHLVMDLNINPSSIQVLMFNKLASKQFYDMVQKLVIPSELNPKINTFHSFAYGFIRDMMGRGLLPGQWEFWTDDQQERERFLLHRVVSSLEKNGLIPPESVDIEEALQAIQLWKSSLIPPTHAGYRGNPHMTKIYEAFEEERIEHQALTYNDFIPLVVGFLENNQDLRWHYGGSLQHVIVDEYQDVNYGQQCLIELLAGKRADVMVVGDDDQTIYEWRGARPNYIIREFQSVFDNKPIIQHTLSNSFRFGAVIAQCANNTISFNTNRVNKTLIAHNIKKPSNIFLYDSLTGQSKDTNTLLSNQVVILVKEKLISPSRIIVLCRMFAQLSGIQAEFMRLKIPFRVVGQKPFFERREIQVLLDYVRLSAIYYQPVNELSKRIFLNISNTPNRMIARRDLEQLMDGAKYKTLSVKQALEFFLEDPRSSLNSRQRERVLELMSVLETTYRQVNFDPTPPVHEILTNLITSLDYLSHYENYYGKGESSFEHKQSVLNFIKYAEKTNFLPQKFLDHISKLDTTRGAPEDQQIIMTTIFRTKGLEYDYVIIPSCDEGYMPCLYETGQLVYDLRGEIKEPEPSEAIENERRLFYVAITRAKEAVCIGSSLLGSDPSNSNSNNSQPSRFIDEIQWEATNHIMTALQHTAAKEPGGRSSLISNIKKFGGRKNITEFLLSKYLTRLNDNQLLGTISQIIASSSEIPFRYRFANPSAKIVGGQREHTKPNLHSSWDDIDY